MMRIAATTLAVLAVACGGASLQPKTIRGATLEGTVQGAATPLSVDVPGTSRSTHTDAAGHFALIDVPEGSDGLHFSGKGVDATLQIPALSKQEHRNISVTVSGNDAVERHEQSEAELRGTIDSIAAPSFVVGGKTIATTSATVFRKHGAAIAFADLSTGDLVEVEGAVQQDGSILARSVTVEDPAPAGGADDAAEAEVTFEGMLAIDGSTFTVGATVVRVDASTRIEKNDQLVAASALAAGDQLRVEGILQSDASVLAKEIHVMSAAEAAEVKVAGAVASVSPADGTFTIGTTVLHADAHTSFSGSGSFASLADMHMGDLLDVEAAKQADGSLLALEVHRLDVPEMNEIEVKGAIEQLGAASLQVQGKSFAVDSATEFRDGLSFAALKQGQNVEVRGVTAADGTLHATRVSPQN